MPHLIAALLLLQAAVISVHTELVTVPVVVTDARGRHVAGLGPEHFRVYEDGRPQSIAAFDHGDQPITLGLVVDRSQSMRPKRSALLVAIRALVGPGHDEDELFGVGFNDRVALALPPGRPFTRDATEIAAALSGIPAEGRTGLYDGVAEALQHLQLGRTARKALIVVSDGGDNASGRTYAEVLAIARRFDAVIYAIGLMGTPPIEEEEDGRLLERLAKATGGAAYFPRTMGEVAAVSAQVARSLREQYVLGFVPSGSPSARTFRRIEVRVSAEGHGRLHVRARSGYTAGEGGEP
jgi:VWFA-related protein